jgi:lipopolysaccharide export system permease protein
LAAWPGYSIGKGLIISALRLPSLIELTMPFVVLFSAMSVLMTLNRRYELVIARSAGVSAWQFLLPICTGSFLIGIVTITAFNTFSAYALNQSQLIETGIRGGVSPSDKYRLPWLRQRTDEGATIIGAKKTAQRGLLLSDATFIRFDTDGDIHERLDAREAVLGDGAWKLTDVTRFDSEGKKSSLPTALVATGLKPEFVEEQFAAPGTIPLFELGEKIDAARSFGLNANAFSMQYHSLLALPPLLVAMTLIAATVSMRFARLGQSALMILGGVMAGFLLYVVTVFVKTLGSSGLVLPVVAAWTPSGRRGILWSNVPAA